MKKLLRCNSWWFFLSLHLGFALLYYLAYHFRLERTQLEAAHELLCVINNESFCITMPGRFVLALSQLSVLVMVLFDAPLENIVSAYSLHHIAFFHLLSFICLFIGAWRSALLQLVIPVASIGASFFMWPFAELLYGIGIAFTAWSIWKNLNPSWWKGVILSILVILVFASHPLAVLLMLFLLAFEDAGTKELRISPYLILFSGYLLFRHVFSMWVPDKYTGMSWHQTWRFLWYPDQYPDVWSLFVLMCLVLAFGKNRLARSLTVTTALMLIWSSIQIAGHSVELYHAVVVMLMFHVILQTPFPRTYPRSLAVFLVFLFVAFNASRSIQEAGVFIARKELIQNLVAEAWDAKEACLVMEGADRFIPDNAILKSPSYRHETLLISSMNGQPVTVINAENFARLCKDHEVETDIHDPVDLVEKAFSEDCSTLAYFGYYRCDAELNSDYFQLPEDEGYTLIEPELADWEARWVDSETGELIPLLSN